MRYLIPLCIFLTSCTGGLKIQDFDHPIDPVQQQKLINTESAIVKIDLFKLSMLALIVTSLIVGIWWFSVRKNKPTIK
jgi:hypothetical protein